MRHVIRSRPICSTTMPKTPGSSPKAKAEPYRKESPKKQAATKITWTEEADRAMIRHVLSNSEIKLRYNWTELQKSTFPDLTVKQVNEPP